MSDTSSTLRPRAARLRAWAWKPLLFAALVMLSAEGLLQVAALFAGDRATEPVRGQATRLVLCVGDSHTYGAGVAPDQSFPAQLQRILDERLPGRFAVLNLGLPGMNTAQVRARLPGQVARYQPDLVVAWVGVNNAWNVSGMEASRDAWGLALEAWALRSRLYRLWRVHAHERDKWLPRADGVRQSAAPDELQSDSASGTTVWRFGDDEDAPAATGRSVRHQRSGEIVRDDDRFEATVHADLAAIDAWLARAGIPLVLIRYPLDLPPNDVVNRSIARVAEERGVPVVDSQAAVLRLPPEQRRYLFATHPNGAMYGEVARDLADRVVAELGPDSGASP